MQASSQQDVTGVAVINFKDGAAIIKTSKVQNNMLNVFITTQRYIIIGYEELSQFEETVIFKFLRLIFRIVSLFFQWQAYQLF